MTLISKIRENLSRNGIQYAFLISGISGVYTLASNGIEKNRLEKSNYVLKVNQSVSSLYGYDDDKNGLVERIVEVGVVPFETGTPAFRIRETHTPLDKNYEFYLKRLFALGKTKIQ